MIDVKSKEWQILAALADAEIPFSMRFNGPTNILKYWTRAAYGKKALGIIKDFLTESDTYVLHPSGKLELLIRYP